MTKLLRFTAVLVLPLAAACSSDVDVEKVPVGTEVAVTRQDGGVVRGTLTERDAAAVKVDVGPAVRSVPRDQIAVVQVVDAETPVELPPVARFRELTLPASTPLVLRLGTGVDSASSQVEDRVEATLSETVRVDGIDVLPAGAVLAGTVSRAEAAGKVKGRASLSLRFDTLTVPGHDAPYDIAASMSRTADATKGDDAKKIGIPAAGGAVIGAILGGKKGAAVGGAIGGGAGTAVVLATAGPEVRLAAGSVLTVTLDRAVDIRVPLGQR